MLFKDRLAKAGVSWSLKSEKWE